MNESTSEALLARLVTASERIAAALERQSPPPLTADLTQADSYVWYARENRLAPATETRALPLDLLLGVERQAELLLANTKQFAAGLPANNALLWGAKGMGKSSLVKAVHAAVNRLKPHSLALVEAHRDELGMLPQLLRLLQESKRPALIFCDDLSFIGEENDYRTLKSLLDGGLNGQPGNVLFYATSNRRHLIPRSMIENEQATAISPGEAIDEKVSLSDRFGLWLGFHYCDETQYLAIVERYAQHFSLAVKAEILRAEAHEWAITRGARSGRVAWQFIQDLAGRQGKKLAINS